MKGRILSKTSFIRGRQCEKSLWLYFFRPALRDRPDELRRSLFGRGHKVGYFARGLFPGGGDSSPANPARWSEAVALTQKFIAEGKEVIYEAAFEYGECLVYADILVKAGDAWKVYEVKSSLRVSDYHLQDASFQYYVIKGAGCEIESFHIVHPNPDFVHEGEITPERFFFIHDVTARVVSRQEEIIQGVASFKRMLEQQQMPVKEVGAHCQSPYPCDFKTFCWGKPSPRHILSLPAFSVQDSSRLLNSGISDIGDISTEEQLSSFHRSVIRSIQENRSLVNVSELKKWFSKIEYPIAFFDLEMFMPAIPLYKGSRPFEHLPFAYSLRRIEKEGETEHPLFFMASAGSDPREPLSRQLIHDLEGTKTLIVFDSSQEHAVFRKLGNLFPENKSFMEQLCSRTADLADLFVGRKVYFPSMGNSFSLKSLSFLAGIQMDQLRINNGYDASAAYELLHEPRHLFQETELKEDLRRYSTADTEILSRIFQKLTTLTGSDDYITID
jgi:CRISPR/Cas system-associated exonuclease Cas4 (RecB family)